MRGRRSSCAPVARAGRTSRPGKRRSRALVELPQEHREIAHSLPQLASDRACEPSNRRRGARRGVRMGAAVGRSLSQDSAVGASSAPAPACQMLISCSVYLCAGSGLQDEEFAWCDRRLRGSPMYVPDAPLVARFFAIEELRAAGWKHLPDRTLPKPKQEDAERRAAGDVLPGVFGARGRSSERAGERRGDARVALTRAGRSFSRGRLSPSPTLVALVSRIVV